MRSQAGVAAQMFKALADANINILNITTSEIKVSCIVNRIDGEPGIRAVHESFDLAAQPTAAPKPDKKPHARTKVASEQISGASRP
jgi:aspartate kinase